MRLQDYLQQQSLSDANFARAIGVERQAVHRYKNGLRFPERKVLARIVAETNGAVTANDFLDEPERAA